MRESGELELSDYFERGSVLATLRRRHPYDFADTYELVRQLYGYRRYYVNLGLWRDGVDTVEAGWELVRFLAERMQLAEGASLVDAGAGMGQAAIDLAREYRLREVIAININPRQVRFAGDLTARHGLSDVIEHRLGDACDAVHDLAPGSCDAALAVECIGHFAAPERFLAGVANALVDGGRLAFCLNVADERPGWLARRLMQASYGFVPESTSAWTDRVAAAGLRVVDDGDLTGDVLVPAMQRAIAGLSGRGPATDRLSRVRKRLMRRGCRAVLDAATSGRLAYRYFVVAKPAPVAAPSPRR